MSRIVIGQLRDVSGRTAPAGSEAAHALAKRVAESIYRKQTTRAEENRKRLAEDPDAIPLHGIILDQSDYKSGIELAHDAYRVHFYGASKANRDSLYKMSNNPKYHMAPAFPDPASKGAGYVAVYFDQPEAGVSGLGVGALGGAAAGFAMGGPVGAAIGGLVGAIVGGVFE